MLSPFDTIEGSEVVGFSNLYVVGCYDSRITLYSQQVRALELVHALHDQSYIRPNLQVAIVGGGATGVTLASALALTANVHVHLFESADVVLPLQRDTARRRLDPHIYNWPACDADHEFADLPILDWRTGPSSDVRNTIVREFNFIANCIAPRLEQRLRHRVQSIEPLGDAFEIVFERDQRPGDNAELGARVTDQIRVNMVFLAFGFGLESTHPIQGIQSQSYWSDAGVPGQEIGGCARPRFFVSGNGDGGLIDLVAAAMANFDHAGMINSIVHQAGIIGIFDALDQIEEEARACLARNEPFDFFAAYEGQILAAVEGLGLIESVRRRLRAGVQLTFQTQHPQLMAVETATLNRLAVYLVIKACDRDALASFQHLYCDVVTAIAQPAGVAEPAPLWFDCDGTTVGADRAIVRRGPGKADVRRPFDNVLAGYEASHDVWVTRHSRALLVPQLSERARDRFEQARRDHAIPPPAHQQQRAAAAEPIRLQVRPIDHGALRWTGDRFPDQVAEVWDAGRSGAEIYCPAAPVAIGGAGFALVRLALHHSSVTLFVDAAVWRRFIGGLSSESPNADDLLLPNMRPFAGGGSIRMPQEVQPNELGATLHRAMDRWMLAAVDSHLRDYFQSQRDLGNRIGFMAAALVRQRMQRIWAEWCTQFEADMDTLGRFFRLTLCAVDTDETRDEASVLVGPKKILNIVRATAVALIVAVGWETMTPHAARPGNLSHSPNGGAARTGHACAAERITGKNMAMIAAKFIWNTHFVVLPNIARPFMMAARSTDAFSKTVGGQPLLTEAEEQPNIMVTVDEDFIAAAEESVAAVTQLLDSLEGAHFARLSSAIEEAGA